MAKSSKQLQAPEQVAPKLSWFERLWPFGRKKREQRRRIEQDFQEQLKEAYQRRGDLEEATKQLRAEREQRQAESKRVLVARQKLVSRPSFQE